MLIIILIIVNIFKQMKQTDNQDIIQEIMEDKNIKKYVKGRLLGKVQFHLFREVLLNAINSFLSKQANDMLPRSLIKNPYLRAKHDKNFNLKYSFTNPCVIRTLSSSSTSFKIINQYTSYQNFAAIMYLGSHLDPQ